MNNVSPTDQNAQVQQVTGSEPKDAVHFLDYWQILYSRKEITIAVAILLILTGIVITRRMPKVYAAYSIIEVQRETPNIDIFGRASLRYDPIFLRTQFEIIKSRPVIEQVVREAHLSEEFGMAYGWKATESAKGVFERSVALVQKRTNLSILQDTNLIVIEVRLDKPERPEGEAAKVATRVANTIAKVFSDYTRAKSRSNIETALETLNDEIKELDRQIAATEDSLSQIRAENGIVNGFPDELNVRGVDLRPRNHDFEGAAAHVAFHDNRVWEHFGARLVEACDGDASGADNENGFRDL